jgi:hypothetical protein
MLGALLRKPPMRTHIKRFYLTLSGTIKDFSNIWLRPVRGDVNALNRSRPLRGGK